MMRVFIVEDHPVVRKGYIALITREPGLEVCGEATTAHEALQDLPVCDPDFVVLDVSLPGEMDGVDLLRELKQQYPALPVLVVSGNDEAMYGKLVVKSGAWGYVMKGEVEEFLRALRTLAEEVEGASHRMRT